MLLLLVLHSVGGANYLLVVRVAAAVCGRCYWCMLCEYIVGIAGGEVADCGGDDADAASRGAVASLS